MNRRSRILTEQMRHTLGRADADLLLGQLAEELKRSDAASAETVQALERFSAFCDAVDVSLRYYEEREEAARRHLDASTAELSENNRAMEAMLNSLEECFLFFNEQGICSPVFSHSCLEMLETNPANTHIRDVLRLTGKERETIDSWIAMLFNNDLALSFSDLAAIAPVSYRHSKGMSVQLRFKPMYRADKTLAAVLVVATDKTPEEKAKKELKMRESRALRTLRIARNRNHFLRFIEQCQALFTLLREEDAPPSLTLDQFKRDIHTIKGIAATFQLEDLAHTINAMESDIANLMERGNATLRNAIASARKFLPDVQKHFSAAKTLAAEVLGDNFEQLGSIRTVEISRLLAFSEHMKRLLHGVQQAEELDRYFLEFIMAVPVHSALHFIDMMMQETAEKLGKRIRSCQFEGENFKIFAEPYEDFFNSLVHAAGNILDHGIEEPQLREQMGKPVEGTITLTTQAFSQDGMDWMRLCLEDDGAGIDVPTLRDKLARKRGESAVHGKSDAEVMQMIFEDDVSVRSEVSEYSGRGVGMSAVKAEVTRLGGKIWVESTPYLGTKLFIELPMIWEMRTDSLR